MKHILSSLLLSATLTFGLASQAHAGAAEKFEGALPATLEGQLVIEVPAAEVEENDENVAFGSLVVGGKEYAVEVPDALLQSAKVPAEGGDVKATLGEETEEFGFPMYRVTALELR
jgi:hypothetical protein